MSTLITSVGPRSPAQRRGIRAGEYLVSINGHEIQDVLDYRYYSYDAVLDIVLENEKGRQRRVRVKKGEGDILGLAFETELMDRARSCANNCVFCFIDQLPRGMRPSLYFKDDDARLSFLTGNYITMTNLSQREIQRICDLKISPINVSVHTTNPELRVKMLRNPRASEVLEVMDRFAAAGITMNCQIVCCPGINDGEELKRTLRELEERYPRVNSACVIPVGLTRHREGLYELKPFDKESAGATIDLVDSYGEECLSRHGRRIFYCSDEFFIMAERELPPEEYYEGYVQLENGVGMLRLLEAEFLDALPQYEGSDAGRFSIASGVSAAPFLEKLMCTAKEKCANMEFNVYPIVNDFFGHSINVSGLVTGQDLIAQLRGRELGERLYIPTSMLRAGEEVMLDDLTVSDVERELGVRVVPVMQSDGYELARGIFEYSDS